MALISFLFFQCKTAFNVNTCHVISNISQLLPPDHLKIANCSNLTIVFYPLGNFGQALCMRSCQILTRKSHNCSGIGFIQLDSAGGSKLIWISILLFLLFGSALWHIFQQKGSRPVDSSCWSKKSFAGCHCKITLYKLCAVPVRICSTCEDISVPVSHILSTREDMHYQWVISSVPVSQILSTCEDMQYP